MLALTEDDHPFVIFEYNGYGIVAAIVIAVIVLLSIVLYILVRRGSRTGIIFNLSTRVYTRMHTHTVSLCIYLFEYIEHTDMEFDDEEEDERKEDKDIEISCKRFHNLFHVIFTAWGKGILSLNHLLPFSLIRRSVTLYFIIFLTAFATRPIIVLFVFSYVILGLSYGITYLSITSNPIEIWAAPTSRSRIEKDYFDSHFQPFYRTEQIYIKAVGLGKVKLTDHNNYFYRLYLNVPIKFSIT